MFLFPLGLGLPLPKFPWITLLLILSQMTYYFMDKSFSVNQTELAMLYSKSEKQEHLVDLIITQDCQQTVRQKEFCSPIENFFKNIDRQNTESLLEKWNTLNLDQRKFVIETRQEIYKQNKNLSNTSKLRSDYINSIEIQETAQSDYIDEHLLLAQGHIDFSRLMHAQFSHMNLSHLLFNLAFLAVFGAYVELAVGSLYYLFTYFAAGFIGLTTYASFFAGANIPVLGSSANIAGIIGTFFILFLRHKMSFFVLILFYFRVAKIKVLWAMPIIFFARELLGTLEKDSGVAHQAHLVGYFIGILCAFALRKYKKLEGKSLYKFEVDLVNSWDNKQMSQIMNDGSRILKFNPQNTWAREMIIKRLINLENQGKLSVNEMNNLHSLIGMQIRLHLEQDEINNIMQLLKSLPQKINYKSLCLKMTKESILDLAELAFEKNCFLPSATFLKIYYEHFPENKSPKEADELASEVCVFLYNENEASLHGIKDVCNSIYFKNIIEKVIEQNFQKRGA